jgi:hypothetical protein
MAKRDPRTNTVIDLQIDSQQDVILSLSGNGGDLIMLRPSYTGFVSYQLSDPDSTLSGSLTINLEMSNDGINWLQATDSGGEVITHTLAAGGTVMEKLSDVNPAIKLRLNLVTAVTGDLQVSTRI